MKYCGIGAIEAQISSEDGAANGESIGEPIASETKEERAAHRGMTTPVQQQKKVNHGKRNDNVEEIPRMPNENLSKSSSRRTKGGLKGLLSSVASLEWSKARQANNRDGEAKSQTSQISVLAFLSGGLKKLAFKGSNLLSLARGLSRPDDVSATYELPEAFSLDETRVTNTGHDESHTISASTALKWRSVRLIVQGVRGERCRLAETVRFRAARRIQGQLRIREARKAVIQHQASTHAARLHGEECRLQRRKREADDKRWYKELCRKEGERLVTRILEWSLKCFMQPRAAVDLQRVWRGHRVRKRRAAYLRWPERRRRKRKEYERYFTALAAIRGAGDWRSGQVKRRVWGRTEFTHSGWKPRYEVEDPPSMHDYVWNPPRCSTSGVRTHKVILPPSSEAERQTLTEDKNAWAGVIVGFSRQPPASERLGPPPRPGTVGAARAMPPSVGAEEGGEGRRMVAKYNWLPAPLLSKAGLLQTPLKD